MSTTFESPTLLENIQKLESFSEESKHNSPNKRVSKEILEKAKWVLVKLEENETLQPPFITFVGGDIQLGWENDCFYLEVSVTEDRDLEVFLADQIDVDKGSPLALEGKCFRDENLNYLTRLINLFYRKEV